MQDLPELPPPDFAAPTIYEYTAEQMQAYARQAVLMERAAGWRACAGCPAENDCRMHGCGEARGLWKIETAAIRGS